MTIESGTCLSHYEIVSTIGVGGMGEVYRARDRKLNREVAIKVLPETLAQDPDRLARFQREAQVLALLNHPNIAHIYEIGEHNDRHFIAMEFIDGETLTMKLHRDKDPLSTLLGVLSHIAEGLAKAHAAGVVHRDLKPDNVIIARDGYAKILDFGLAKLIEPHSSPIASGANEDAVTAIMQGQPLSAAGTVMGTVGYMSPEQAQGKTLDQRSDIFSFGCILYEVATRRRPFEGDSAIDTLHKIIYETPPPIADFNSAAPADLQRIARRCLAKDPDKRYQTIRDLANDLEDLGQEIKSASEAEWSIPPKTAAAFSVSGVGAGFQVVRTTSSAEFIISMVNQHKGGIVALLVLLALAAFGYVIYDSSLRTGPAVTHFLDMKITRVTSEGNVESTAVSPDGKYIAYSMEQSGKRSLWTKHLGTGSRVQIVMPVESLAMNAGTFSGDGGYVYYTRADEQNPQGALYRVPVLGGASKKILDDVAQPVSISPDGKRLAFQRIRRSGAVDEIFLANVDGTGEHRLVEIREPQWLTGGMAAWSPDGQMLCLGYGNGKAMVLAVVSVADGTLRPITSREWLFIGSVEWFADGSGVAFTAREQVLGAIQIWQASYPLGEVRRITNDLNSYAAYGLSLTANGRGIVTVQGDPMSNIWVAPDGDASRARAVTTRKNVQEGHYAVAWTPQGQLLYDSDANGKSSIWVVNSDGSEPKPLTDGTADDYAPQPSPEGRTIIFGSRRTNLYEIWRMDSDGANPKQLTEETGVPTFSVSPDGHWVIYSPFVGGIRKVSVDGGPPVELVAHGDQRNPQMSPDGKLVAYLFNDKHTKGPKIAVINSEGGAPVKTFDLPVTSGSAYESFSLLYRGFHWSPDGRALVYINTLDGVSNLWRQPLDGGKPAQITDFKSDLIYNFAYALDGRTLAFARGSHTRDGVLINDVK